MADLVQQMMEQMLPEMEDLLARGIFSQEEVKGIIKQRRQFEYSLHRRAPEKIDFLKAAQYEMELDSLRKARKKSLGIKKKNIISEQGCIRRLFFIFDRAVRRFKGDVSMWLQYAEFCKASKSFKALSRVYGRALQFLPKHVNLWISAASWEFSDMGNMVSARALLQRGVRANPESKELLLAYFRLELLYMLKLNERRKLLGLVGTEPSNLDAAATVASEAFFECALPKVVYQSAVKAIPDEVDFRLAFLREYQKYPGTDSGQKDICQTLISDFPDNAVCWTACARRELDSLPTRCLAADLLHAVDDANAVFAEAEKHISGSELSQSQSQMYREVISRLAEEPEHIVQLVESWLKLFESARTASRCSAAMYSEWVDVLLRLGRHHEALDVAQNALVVFPRDAVLLRQKTQLLLSSMSVGQTVTAADVLASLKSAVTMAPSADSFPLWRMLIDFVLTQQSVLDVSTIQRVFQDAVNSNCGHRDELIRAYVQWALCVGGISLARTTYQQYLRMPRVGLALFEECVLLERQQLRPDVAVVRRLFDQALDAFSQQTDLWLQYVQFERDAGNVQQVYQIHYRATKTLKDATEFNARYNAIK